MHEYVQSAIKKGLKEIGFADHVPVQDDYDPWHRMAWEQFPTYVESVQQLREAYPEIKIRLGIEADVYPSFERSLEAILNQYPIDYVFGSVHFMDGEAVFKRPETDWDETSIRRFIQKYFDWHHQGIKSGLFDVVAHTDVIKWHFSDFMPLIEHYSAELYDAVAEAGMAIELNTSGLRKKPQETYPSKRILGLAFDRGIPVLPGSDAHQPEEIACCFKEARAMLSDCGYRHTQQTRQGLTAFVSQPV